MFTIKGCSLIRGVHYERFRCILYWSFKLVKMNLKTISKFDHYWSITQPVMLKVPYSSVQNNRALTEKCDLA